MAKKSAKKEKSRKRSLLASLFEPAEQSETEISFGEFEPDEQELVNLFEDEEEIPVVDEDEAIAPLILQEPSRPMHRGRNAAARHRQQPEILPSPQDENVPLSDEQDTVATEPDSLVEASALSAYNVPSIAEETSKAESSPIPSGSVGVAAFLARNQAPARAAVGDITQKSETIQNSPAFPAVPKDESTGENSPEDSESIAIPETEPASVPEDSDHPTVPEVSTESIQLFDDEPEEESPISLFEEDDTAKSGLHRQHTRLVRGKGGVLTRVTMNETESFRASEAARQRQRAIYEKEQQEKEAARLKRQKKRRRRMKNMAMNLTIGSLVGAVVLVILFFVFLLSNIMVTGNDIYTDEYIIELSGLKLGRHMLLCDLDAAKKGIETNPYLQVNAIDYIFPSRIRIRVTERKEVAGIIGLDHNVIIDHSGYVLSMSGGMDISDLVLISGISMSGFQVGERLGQTDDFSTATLVSILGKLEDYGLIQSIANIDMTTPLAITLTTRQGIKVFIGQPTELDEKMAALYQLLPRFAQSSISSGTLYLSSKGGAVYSPTDHNASAIPPVEGTDAGTDYTLDNDYPIAPVVTPAPVYSLPNTSPTPVPLVPGGGDGFQG